METKLMELRKAAGYSNRDDFAAAIKVKPDTYKTWENGKVTINVQQACMLSDFLGCSLDDLIGRKVESKPAKDLNEDRLVSMYRGMTDQGRAALLASAEGLYEAFRVKNNQVSKTA